VTKGTIAPAQETSKTPAFFVLLGVFVLSDQKSRPLAPAYYIRFIQANLHQVPVSAARKVSIAILLPGGFLPQKMPFSLLLNIRRDNLPHNLLDNPLGNRVACQQLSLLLNPVFQLWLFLQDTQQLNLVGPQRVNQHINRLNTIQDNVLGCHKLLCVLYAMVSCGIPVYFALHLFQAVVLLFKQIMQAM